MGEQTQFRVQLTTGKPYLQIIYNQRVLQEFKDMF